jgi:hypothetical protein
MVLSLVDSHVIIGWGHEQSFVGLNPSFFLMYVSVQTAFLIPRNLYPVGVQFCVRPLVG